MNTGELKLLLQDKIKTTEELQSILQDKLNILTSIEELTRNSFAQYTENKENKNSRLGYPFLFKVKRDDKFVYIVMFADSIDYTRYNPEWMHDCAFKKSDDVFVPDIDTRRDRDLWVFDSNDDFKNWENAIQKMKELWASISTK